MVDCILVADSGSTKTDWRLLSADKVLRVYEGIGLNPDFHTEESMHREIEKVKVYMEENQPSTIYFYGSGASSKSRKKPIENALRSFFPNAVQFIEHDLVGAAHAVHGDQEGLVGILGTGSNCCTFNGTAIVEEYRSGGFVLSDEGGGVALGKMILKAYIEDYLEFDLRKSFEEMYSLNVDAILQAIYKEAYPNRFIASFSRFAKKHENHPQMANMIAQNFEDFFSKKVCRFTNYQSYELGIVGSMAVQFKDALQLVAQKHKVRLGKIESKPIEALAAFHMTRLAAGR